MGIIVISPTLQYILEQPLLVTISQHSGDPQSTFYWALRGSGIATCHLVKNWNLKTSVLPTSHTDKRHAKTKRTLLKLLPRNGLCFCVCLKLYLVVVVGYLQQHSLTACYLVISWLRLRLGWHGPSFLVFNWKHMQNIGSALHSHIVFSFAVLH